MLRNTNKMTIDFFSYSFLTFVLHTKECLVTQKDIGIAN